MGRDSEAVSGGLLQFPRRSIRRWAVLAATLLSIGLFLAWAAAAQGQQGGSGGSCPPGCAFICLYPDPECGCYGYCRCENSTPAPTPTPSMSCGRTCFCYRYVRKCSWGGCPDPWLGQMREIIQVVDCSSGDVIREEVVSEAPCGSCRLRRDCNQPGACTPTPQRFTTPTPAPTPRACDCPGPQEIFFDPSYSLFHYPPHPIVIGQGGSGVTVRVQVTIPDWILRRFYREPRRVCLPGTPEPGGIACTTEDGRPGHIEWRHGECQPCGDSSCQGGCPSGMCFVPYCTSEDERYAEYATGGTIRLSLRQSSIDWILGELASRYPGARVYQAVWESPARVVGTYDAGGATVAILEAHFPVRDPGYYDVQAVIATNKRTLTWTSNNPLSVYLKDTSIIR